MASTVALGTVFHVQLLKDVADVRLNGLLGDVQTAGDLLVCEALDDEA